MNKIGAVFHESDMESFIKGLLSLSDGSIWSRQTVDSQISFLFKGNNFKIQKALYDWLSVPERKQKFELLGGKK